MAINNIGTQQARKSQEALSTERERLRVQAKELQRRRLILENELQSSGATAGEREYLQQRIQALSNDEDAIGPKLAQIERDLASLKQKESERGQQAQQSSSAATSYARTVGKRKDITAKAQGILSASFDAAQKQYALLKKEDQREIDAAQKKIAPPSKFIYFVLIYIAVIADVLGLLDLTGAGAIVVFIIDLIFSVFFFAASFWLGRKIKRVRVSGERISRVISGVEQRIALYRQRLALALRYARRTKAGRSILRSSIGRRAIGLTAKFTKTARYPMIRATASYLLELIPFVNLLPWYTINMVLTYREHRREYQASLETAKEYQPTSSEEREAFRSLQEAQVAERIAELQAA